MESRTLQIAAVQLQCTPGRVADNLARARPLVEEAARRGAELVVLPEMFAQGYRVDHRLWEVSEPADGATTRWLRDTARALRVTLGGGHVITDGSDFYNVFTLCGSDGAVLGRVYKANAESYAFRRERRSHLIQTPLGRIGVGICADNQFVDLPTRYRALDVDLVLMPHAWPLPLHASGAVSDLAVRTQREHLESLPGIYAHLLGVPAVFINQTGPLEGMPGLLGRFVAPPVFGIPGLSRIVDSDERLLGALGPEEGVLVAGVTLAPDRKHWIAPDDHDGWILPGAFISRRVMVPFDIAVGQLTYLLSRERTRRAREACAQPSAR